MCKINSKWMKDLNIKPEIIKLPEVNISSKLLDIGLGKDFSYLIPKAWEKIFANPLSDKWLLSKIYKEHIKFKVKTKQFDYKMGRGSE